MDTRKINFLIAMQNSIDAIEKREGNTPKIEKIKSKFYNLVEFEREDNEIKSLEDFQKIINGEFVYICFILNNKKEESIFKLVDNVFYQIDMKKREFFVPLEDEFFANVLTEIWKYGFCEIPDKNGTTLKANFDFFKKINTTKLIKLRTYHLNQNNNLPKLNIEENAVENNLENSVPIQRDKKKTVIILLHKPKETYLFLNSFNSNEGGLKNLTHRFNFETIDYEIFIANCKKEFEKCKSDYPNVPQALLTRINEFAFSTKPRWYIRKGKEKIEPNKGWSCPEFIEWYNLNKTHPGNDARWNNEMIIPFKESIQVRADTDSLERIIDDMIKNVFGESKENFVFNIDEQIRTAQFYTDVDNFGQALFHVFSTIKDISIKNFCYEISVNYIDETLDNGKFKKIIITHINSEATRNSNDPNFAQGDLKSITNNLWGLCNYEIHAKFPDGYFRKFFLTDDNEEYKNYVLVNKSVPINDISQVKGFTHILKFY
ncbi:MAG: hypothetical protein ACOYOV_05855 [Bacteroidales bacterium]